MKLAFITLVALSSPALAQSQSSRPAFDVFEVAAIKPSPTGVNGGRFMRMQSTHQFIAKNYTLRVILAAAYNLTPSAVSGGPAWVDTDRFDFLAEAPGAARPSLDEQMAMLRGLLTERFKLNLHREEKEFSIYTLTVAKSGSKLKESLPNTAPEGPPPLVFVLYPEKAALPGRNATMGEFASVLQRAALNRPVLDKTGLSGRYDFDLEWRPDDTQFGGAITPGTQEAPLPDLFAALQRQLGLKLEAGRGPIRTLVIDTAEKPAEN